MLKQAKASGQEISNVVSLGFLTIPDAMVALYLHAVAADKRPAGYEYFSPIIINLRDIATDIKIDKEDSDDLTFGEINLGLGIRNIYVDLSNSSAVDLTRYDAEYGQGLGKRVIEEMNFKKNRKGSQSFSSMGSNIGSPISTGRQTPVSANSNKTSPSTGMFASFSRMMNNSPMTLSVTGSEDQEEAAPRLEDQKKLSRRSFTVPNLKSFFKNP